MFWASVHGWRRGCRIGGMARTPHSRGKNERDGNSSHLKEQPSERLRIGLVDYGSLRVTLKTPNNVLHSKT
jgi:hypothetical protein